jgi:hypothetical protein
MESRPANRGGSAHDSELSYSDDSSLVIPALFMFVPGMSFVVNRNIYRDPKLVNVSIYKALGCHH